VCNKGITQFYLSPAHKPYPPLLPSRKASPPFGWYSLRLPTNGWPGWVDPGGWLHTKANVPHRESNPDTVTYPSTNRDRRRLTRWSRPMRYHYARDHHLTGAVNWLIITVSEKQRLYYARERWDPLLTRWRSDVVVARWSRSTKLIHVGPS